MKKSVKIAAPCAVCALAVTACLALVPGAARADSDAVELTPVEANPSITYNYFDAPCDVFADSAGIIVSSADGLDFVKREANGYAVSSSLPVVAQKSARLGNYIVTLEGGVLNCRYGDSVESFGETVTDFCIANELVYALSDGKITVLPVNDTLFDEENTVSVELDGKSSAELISVCGDSVFVVTGAAFANKSDVCAVDMETGALDTVLRQSDKIISISAMQHSEVLYTLTRDAVTGYAVAGGGLARRYYARDGRMTDIYAFDGFLYGLDTLDALYMIKADLGGETAEVFKPIMASANDSLGFFDLPSGACAKNSTLFVADTANNRIVTYKNDVAIASDESFDRPVAVACDSSGTLYVAHAYNTLSVISRSGRNDFKTDGGIKSVVVNADKQAFVAAADGLYVIDGNEISKAASTAFKSVTLSAGKDELYALTDEAVIKLEYADGELTQKRICAADADACSIAVDLDGSVYALARNALVKTDANGVAVAYRYTVNGKPYTLGSDGHILLGTIANDFIEYGCAVIVDTDKHRVFTADGGADGLSIKLIDGDYEVPDASDDTPVLIGDGLIRTTLYDTPVFGIPAETPPVYTIGAGRKVIVAQYAIADSREYSYILIDDVKNGKLLSGYVYKDALSSPLPYSEPQAEVGSVFANATPVYKWPSQNSVTLRDYAAVKRGTNFTIMPFVSPFRDDYGNLWIRVSVEGCDGYILAKNISLGNYEPSFIRPAYNAEIISYEGSLSAPCYELVDGKYLPIAVTLPTGTKIEVVGAYDTSEKYTQVKYLDTELGTLTCYVPTEYIKYNGVNIVPIVAVVVIVITLILAAIIIGRVTYLNRKRLTANPAQKTDKDFEDDA